MNVNKIIRDRRDKEIFDIGLEAAAKYGLEEEYRDAIEFFHGDVLMALEDWDLLDEEVINKIHDIKKQYNEYT